MKKISLKLFQVFPILTIASLLQFCAPALNTTSSDAGYEEDLSVYRTEYEVPDFSKTEYIETKSSSDAKVYVEPTHHLKSELDTVINRIVDSRKNITRVDGYSIQLYTGNNRDRAYVVKSKTYEISEELRPRISYDQPNYKVRVGKYYTRLEANADLVLLQKHFRRAVLIPTKIKIPD